MAKPTIFLLPVRRCRTPIALVLAFIGGASVSAQIPKTAPQKALEVHDLKGREGSPSEKLFEHLSAEKTGVRYVKKAVSLEERPELAQSNSFSNLDQVVGVCAGDYDGDDRPDLFFSYPYGGHRLFRNLGGFRFEDTTEAAGLLKVVGNHWAVGCSFVDYDGDGDLDLFVAGVGDPNLLLENQGDGTFQDRAEAMGVARKGANVQMAFADYDLDGDLDAYLVTNRGEGKPQPPENTQVQGTWVDGELVIEERFRETFDIVIHPEEGMSLVEAGEYDRLFRNDGQKFTDVSKAVGLRGTDQGLSACWFDYDGDGDPDLYVANDFFGPDRLYRNERGRFIDVTRQILPHVPWFSMGSDVADINNDGLLDLMGTDMAGSSHYTSKMGMGDMDRVGWFLTTSNPQQYMRNALFINSGGGRFLEAAQLAGIASTDWTWSVKFADLDNDGWVDVFGTNGMTHDSQNSDLMAQAKVLSTQIEKAAFWQKLPPKRDTNFAFRNAGDLRFEGVETKWGLDFNGVSFGAAFADFDGDGDLDLAVVSLEDPVRLYRNTSTEGHVAMIRLVGADRNTWGIGAKVTIETAAGIQVRSLTSSQGYASANEPVVHFGLGSATTIKRLLVRWPRGAEQEFKNLAADKLYVVREPVGALKAAPRPVTPPLLAASTALAVFVHRENSFNDFKVQPLLPHRLSRLGPGMAWGDVDGDGDEDVFLGGGSGQESTLALNDGKGMFTKREQRIFKDQSLLAFEDMGSLFFDADSDGDLDLFVASGGFDPRPKSIYLRDRLYLNDGKGNFDLAYNNTSDLRDSGGPVAAVDFDRDGDLDLFVGGRVVTGKYPTSPNSRLLRNDEGKLVDVTDLLAPGLRTSGMACGALWSDYDGDGWIDLLVTHEWGPLRVWKNHEGKFEEVSKEAGTAEHSGWWTGLAAADVDEDGDLDYIAGNLGLNTKYHASREEPYLAYFGDLDGSGKFRFVEACHEDGVLFPVRGRSCSTNAMPSIAPRFPTFHKFASATLSEIYAPGLLQAAQRFEITELASGIFFNNGKGGFEFRPLPRLAQVSATFGITTPDLDADGHVDLVLAQNFHSTQPETGRVDGGLGLVLLGKGDGTFEPLRYDQSGLLLPGDSKALASLDLNRDARPDLIATVNRGATRSFLNQGRSGQPLAISLRGPKGNLRGIGATITVYFQSGAKRLAEVHSGSSYLTGGSPVIFLGVPEGDALEKIIIRDSSGKSSEHRARNRSGHLVLTLP